jgi:phosphoribosylamine--glycine ligase
VPYVLEFNARMGDPETQVVLPLLNTDLLEVIEAVVEHRLDQLTVEWRKDAAVCVVMTSEGYPGPYRTGVPIRGLTETPTEHAFIFHAGTALDREAVVTAGGRVLGITGVGPDISAAQQTAYRAARTLSFEGCHYRRDIAHRALSLRTPR